MKIYKSALVMLVFISFLRSTGNAKGVEAPVATRVTLESYLDQVHSTNLGFRASMQARDGAALYSQEGSFLYAPNLFATFGYVNDGRPTAQPTFQGNNTTGKTYTLGLSQMTSFGMNARLYYQLQDVTISGTSFPILPASNFYTGAPTLELNQSFWRNGFGSETQATYHLLESQALSTKFMESFKARGRALDAELAYFRLATARESVQIQRGLVERAQKILEWSKRRTNLNLGDRSDTLQAEAALQSRQLDLQIMTDEEASAGRVFNLIRNRNSDIVEEALDPVNSEQVQQMPAPTRRDMREDVKAAEQIKYLTESNATLSKEKAKPKLDVSASVSLNSRESAMNTAIQNSAQTNAYYQVMVNFNAPLEFGTARDIRYGHEKEKLAAQWAYDQKVLETESEWNDLNQKLDEAKKRLGITVNLKKVQEAKMNYERERLMKGRTTTYQVILFEQDYSQAELARLRAENDVLRIIAQMKLFGGASL